MSKVQIYHDNFQNFKQYNIPKKAQLVIMAKNMDFELYCK